MEASAVYNVRKVCNFPLKLLQLRIVATYFPVLVMNEIHLYFILLYSIFSLQSNWLLFSAALEFTFRD